MKQYEVICILRNENANTVQEDISTILKSAGAAIDNVENWGVKKLSYEINKQAEGVYVLFNIGAESSAIATIDNDMRIREDILRYRIFDADDPVVRGVTSVK